MQGLQPFQGWRLTFFQGVMFAVFFIFVLRLYDLQIAQGETWRAAADENRFSRLPLPSDRGVIFDRNGNPLASNAPAYIVDVIPAQLPEGRLDRYEIYNRLSALLDVPPTLDSEIVGGTRVRSIERIVNEGEGIAPFRAVAVAADVDTRVAQRILEERFELPGVNVRAVSVREYPTGALTAHIIGYMGPIGPEEAEALRELGYDPAFDRVGYDGIEAYMEPVLSGARGSELREVDVAGEVVRVWEVIPPVPGSNLRLTIDTELQAAAQQALTDRLAIINLEEQRRAGRDKSNTGVVIAMNPNTGEILAMVSYPSYDNSRFARAIDGEYYLEVFNDPLTPLVNHTVGSLYAPGSAWKLITASGVLEEGVIDPNTLLNDPGDIIVENRYAPNDPAASQRFVCHQRTGHGRLGMVGAIANSCNVYFYQVGGGNPAESELRLRPNGLGINNLLRYANALGIGSELGIQLPGEIAGRMPDPDWKRRVYGENWSTGDTYNAAFGQGYVTVTPLQLITSVQAIVSGTLYQPTLVREVLDQQGGVVQPFEPIVMRTMQLDTPNPDGTITLHLVEDMIIKGGTSLACTCEHDSGFYNAVRCNPGLYRNRADVNPDPNIEDLRDYRVHVPEGYSFNGRVCNRNRFDEDYVPAFISQNSLSIVREGMRGTVTYGTAQAAALDYVNVAGKTGTAEYCDNIALPLGLCVQGQWPSHAWFTGYAPYENPEILVIAFVYNGGEGSGVALPIARQVIDAYFRIKAQREGGTLPGASPLLPAAGAPIPVPSTAAEAGEAAPTPGAP